MKISGKQIPSFHLPLLAAAVALGSVGIARAIDFPRLDSSSGSASSPTVATPSPRSNSTAYTNSMAVLDDTRPLSVGDRVSLRVVEDRKPPVETFVTDSGDMEVPLIGRVKASGKTCKSLAREIKTALDKEYFYNCNVIVGLDLASVKSRGKVYLSGPVKGQGAMELPPDENLTLSRAIMRAGGFNDFTNKKKVMLVRKDRNGKEERFTVDVGSILEKGKTSADIVLQPEDVIIVPQRLFNY